MSIDNNYPSDNSLVREQMATSSRNSIVTSQVQPIIFIFIYYYLVFSIMASFSTCRVLKPDIIIVTSCCASLSSLIVAIIFQKLFDFFAPTNCLHARFSPESLKTAPLPESLKKCLQVLIRQFQWRLVFSFARFSLKSFHIREQLARMAPVLLLLNPVHHPAGVGLDLHWAKAWTFERCKFHSLHLQNFLAFLARLVIKTLENME